MVRLVSLFAAITAITFLSAPGLSSGWFWDAGNALGFCALAGLVYLSMPGAPRRDLRRHEAVGYAVLTVSVLHGLWFLLGDAAAVEWIKPGAPLSMWTGIGGLIALTALIFLAVMPTRMKVHRRYGVFVRWHRVIAWIAAAGVVHHIVATGFYVHTRLQALLLISLVALAALIRPWWVRNRTGPINLPAAGPFLVVVLTLVTTAVFTTLRLPAAP
ncbi:MAG: ferric reductase-like transmembrane domain-containing protein [Pseudomonadota bacterium]